MISCGNITKGLLVVIVLVALTGSGSAAQKLNSCCEQVTRQEITDPILGYWIQSESALPCVRAVVLQTEKGLFCIYPGARWLVPKIKAFQKEKRQTTSSPSVAPSRVSLLSMITSTASPPSPSASLSTSSLPSISSTSEMPVDQNE